MTELSADAVVVGAGHNGLVAANLLADAGWDVLVVEATPHVGGAVRSDRHLHPDFVSDLFSAFYPLGDASPVLRALDLERHGLTWSHAPSVLAHVLPDDRAAVLSRDPAATAASVEAFAAGDGEAYLAVYSEFERIRESLLQVLFRPFPPVRSAAALLRELGLGDALRFARFAVTPVRRFGDERFRGAGAPLLFAGNALHTDLSPSDAGSAIFGWLLTMFGQAVGFPVPVGGSSGLTSALVRRLGSDRVLIDAPVERILLGADGARGVGLASGQTITARQAVLANVTAPQLYRDLVGLQHLPPRMARDLDAFQWDSPTLKLNWALREPIPWTAPAVRGAGTVHLGADLDGLIYYAADLSTGRVPEQPFLLLGQMTTADPSRSPAGTESAWAYTHLPAGRALSTDELRAHVELVEATVERNAPGFRDRVIARSVQGPADLHELDPNLVDGAVNGGTAGLQQQLVFRPVSGLARAETPIDHLYLAGCSAHPGGGVHGGPGANAARAALLRAGRFGRVHRRGLDAVMQRIYRA